MTLINGCGASTSVVPMCPLPAPNDTLNNGDGHHSSRPLDDLTARTDEAIGCYRTSMGNSSFTAGLTRSSKATSQHLSRYGALNRSFNSATAMATDFRRKLHDKLVNCDAGGSKLPTKNTEPAAIASTSSQTLSSTARAIMIRPLNDEDDNNTLSSEGKRANELMRKLSERVKHQVQSSLSEPLRGRSSDIIQTDTSITANATNAIDTSEKNSCVEGEHPAKLNGSRDRRMRHTMRHRSNIDPALSSSLPLSRTSSVRHRVAIFSSRIQQQLPKFLASSNDDNRVKSFQDGEDNTDDIVATTWSDDEVDDPEFLELQEREQIVSRYEKGPDSADVDPWENPDFELYKVTDRFGFVHKNESDLTKEDLERRRVQRELNREHKWLEMLEEWKRRHPVKLPERIWKGVPEKLRIAFWKRLLGVDELRDNARANLYNELLMRARLISKDIKQIDLDINRTYRDHLAFRRRYDVKQQSLFNVLAAYAMFNTEVGYCQGMSQIAALFLMYMNEEDAFWSLHSLLSSRKYAMHGFFAPGFPKLMRFQNHYEKVVQKYLPSVKKHFDKACIPNIHLTKWWFGCFLDRIPFPLALRVWDVFLYHGDCILIVMAFNILKMHKKRILKLQMEGFMDFIQQKLADDFLYSDDEVMESLLKCLKRLQNDRMALPPPPNPDDPPELPTKPLGPILMRSMIDIRMDIAEIHSRCSRANSPRGQIKFIDEESDGDESKKVGALAGRSPAPHRRVTHGKSVASAPLRCTRPAPLDAQQQLGTAAETNASNETSTTTAPSIPAEPFSRVPSLKGRHGGSSRRPLRPPPVPDADGFVPMSPRQQSAAPTTSSNINRPIVQRAISYYDNVPVLDDNDGEEEPTPLTCSNIHGTQVIANDSDNKKVLTNSLKASTEAHPLLSQKLSSSLTTSSTPRNCHTKEYSNRSDDRDQQDERSYDVSLQHSPPSGQDSVSDSFVSSTPCITLPKQKSTEDSATRKWRAVAAPTGAAVKQPTVNVLTTADKTPLQMHMTSTQQLTDLLTVSQRANMTVGKSESFVQRAANNVTYVSVEPTTTTGGVASVRSQPLPTANTPHSISNQFNSTKIIASNEKRHQQVFTSNSSQDQQPQHPYASYQYRQPPHKYPQAPMNTPKTNKSSSMYSSTHIINTGGNLPYCPPPDYGMDDEDTKNADTTVEGKRLPSFKNEPVSGLMPAYSSNTHDVVAPCPPVDGGSDASSLSSLQRYSTNRNVRRNIYASASALHDRQQPPHLSPHNFHFPQNYSSSMSVPVQHYREAGSSAKYYPGSNSGGCVTPIVPSSNYAMSSQHVMEYHGPVRYIPSTTIMDDTVTGTGVVVRRGERPSTAVSAVDEDSSIRWIPLDVGRPPIRHTSTGLRKQVSGETHAIPPNHGLLLQYDQTMNADNVNDYDADMPFVRRF